MGSTRPTKADLLFIIVCVLLCSLVAPEAMGHHPKVSAIEWVTPIHWPLLERAEVHVWLMDLEQWRPELERLAGLLSSDEQERAGRFRLPLHRECYQMSRGLLRLLLAHYTGTEVKKISLVLNEHGKPLWPAPAPIFFNLSHSHNRAVLAFTALGSIGVDVERIRGEMPQQEEITARYFAAGECAALQRWSPADRTGAFFRCWTRKEAFVKARGDGVFGGLQNFEVTVGSAARVRSVNGSEAAAAAWSLADLPAVPGFAGAVAILTGNCTFRFWNASPEALGQD